MQHLYQRLEAAVDSKPMVREGLFGTIVFYRVYGYFKSDCRYLPTALATTNNRYFNFTFLTLYYTPGTAALDCERYKTYFFV